jgi:hypothetical protein
MSADPVTLAGITTVQPPGRRSRLCPPVHLTWLAIAARSLVQGLESISTTMPVLAQAALLEASALVGRPADPRIHEPDPFATEFPFISPGWPHD